MALFYCKKEDDSSNNTNNNNTPKTAEGTFTVDRSGIVNITTGFMPSRIVIYKWVDSYWNPASTTDCTIIMYDGLNMNSTSQLRVRCNHLAENEEDMNTANLTSPNISTAGVGKIINISNTGFTFKGGTAAYYYGTFNYFAIE